MLIYNILCKTCCSKLIRTIWKINLNMIICVSLASRNRSRIANIASIVKLSSPLSFNHLLFIAKIKSNNCLSNIIIVQNSKDTTLLKLSN